MTAAARRRRRAVRGVAMMPNTASFGVAAISFAEQNVQSLIDQADQPLYQSKHGGQNRVAAWRGAWCWQGQAGRHADSAADRAAEKKRNTPIPQRKDSAGSREQDDPCVHHACHPPH